MILSEGGEHVICLNLH